MNSYTLDFLNNLKDKENGFPLDTVFVLEESMIKECAFRQEEINNLNKELKKTREQLDLANEVILDLMQQHIGWNDNPVNAWNYTALSADEKAEDYWSEYLKDKQGE